MDEDYWPKNSRGLNSQIPWIGCMLEEYWSFLASRTRNESALYDACIMHVKWERVGF